MNTDQKKIISATKWSSLAEILAKVVSPITNMILARLISPEAFGIIASVTMITSFAEMFTESGFQKYIIQHQFENEDDYLESVNVAFWTNLGMSLIIWIAIFFSRYLISAQLGLVGYENVVLVACALLPIKAFSSTRIAIFRKEFDFKTLFIVRIIAAFAPLLITVPLAFLGFAHWALLAGLISTQIVTMVILSVYSDFKPKFVYHIEKLKSMFSFSMWAILETTTIWIIAWVDILIIGSRFSQYNVGLYKNSVSTVNSILAIVTASILPVLYSALSQYQTDDQLFEGYFLKFQKLIALIVIPMGFGMYVFRDFLTLILLGENWIDASIIIGLWAMSSGLVVVYSMLNSEVYRAKGKPKFSFYSKVAHIVVLVPTILISSEFGLVELVYARSLVRIHEIIVCFVILSYFFKIRTTVVLKNTYQPLLSAIIMSGIGMYIQSFYNGSILHYDILNIIICIIVYFGILSLSRTYRLEIKQFIYGNLPFKKAKTS